MISRQLSKILKGAIEGREMPNTGLAVIGYKFISRVIFLRIFFSV